MRWAFWAIEVGAGEVIGGEDSLRSVSWRMSVSVVAGHVELFDVEARDRRKKIDPASKARKRPPIDHFPRGSEDARLGRSKAAWCWTEEVGSRAGGGQGTCTRWAHCVQVNLVPALRSR